MTEYSMKGSIIKKEGFMIHILNNLAEEYNVILDE